MPLQNRVTPLGNLIADPARGTVYGNRGCLHDAHGVICRRLQVERWIACRLEFKGRRRAQLLQPGRYTELFFLDEATAFAAGHRPCAECRREDYNRFMQIVGETRAGAIDERLHAERLVLAAADRDGESLFQVVPGARVDAEARAYLAAAYQNPRECELIGELPDAAFVLRDGEPWLVLGDELLRWTPAGYADRIARPRNGEAPVVTPPSLLDVLRAGCTGAVPLLHETARSR